MSNNKQSSVDYLIDNLYLKDSLKWEEIIEQAKAMHKEEHRITANDVRKTIFDFNYKTFDEYYNERFGGEK